MLQTSLKLPGSSKAEPEVLGAATFKRKKILTDTIELPTELAEQLCEALISCVDELTAIHLMKFAHLAGCENPSVRKKIEAEDAVRQKALPVLHEFHRLLEIKGLPELSSRKDYEK